MPVVLSDHDTIEGALTLLAAGADAMAGDEVMTAESELIGLFLTEAILAGLPSKEAVRMINAQGGLVYLDPPYDALRRHLSEEAIENLAYAIGIGEVRKGRADSRDQSPTMQVCEMLGAAPGADPNAHRIRYIGSVCVRMEDFDGAQDFLATLQRGKIGRGRRRVPFA